MTIFFTGCSHFGHARIIQLAGRPFDTVGEMNEALVARWNAKVGPNDRVYHRGDIGWGAIAPWLARLNGEKIIITGNHDDPARIAKLDASCGVIDVTSYLELKASDHRFALFHYPIDDWNGRFRGAIHLHCHTHSAEFRNPNLPRIEGPGSALPDGFPTDFQCNRFNIGVDATDFSPVSVDEIISATRSV